MNRRELIQWITPVVLSVTLPAHARTSWPETPPQNPPSDPPQNPPSEPPPSEEPKKVLICHREPQKQDVEIYVAEPAVPAHIRNHGDTLGKCD